MFTPFLNRGYEEWPWDDTSSMIGKRACLGTVCRGSKDWCAGASGGVGDVGMAGTELKCRDTGQVLVSFRFHCQSCGNGCMWATHHCCHPMFPSRQ